MKAIGIFGGNGFLGRKITEVGIKKGYDVTAFSRNGRVPAAVAGQQWAQKVKWERANIFEPDSYRDKLKEFDAVVHSIGLLFENSSYKSAANSNINFLNDVSQLATFIKGSNPMKRDYFGTYEAIQRDSAVILADAYLKEKEGDHTYVYISADNMPLLPSGYLRTKQEAEFELEEKPGLRTIFMRPWVMYDADEANPMNSRNALTKVLKAGFYSKNAIFGDHVGLFNKLVRPLVSTQQVSEKIYEKIEDSAFDGVVKVEEIHKA